MRFTALVLSVLYVTGTAAVPQEKRAQSSLDLSSALDNAAILTSLFPKASNTFSMPFVTPGGNLLQPPPTLVGAIISALPGSVLIDLAMSGPASSIASEFRAGNTPQWYATLPADIKSYVSALAAQRASGGVDLSATPTPVNWAGTSSPSPTGQVANEEGGDVTSSKSKGMGAQPTQAPLGFSIAAAVGLVGVALAL